jgi:hypothetical protein
MEHLPCILCWTRERWESIGVLAWVLCDEGLGSFLGAQDVFKLFFWIGLLEVTCTGEDLAKFVDQGRNIFFIP